jgi:endonuclease/exonuclease/phosphatase (EEP) superfamily protein YafD
MGFYGARLDRSCHGRVLQGPGRTVHWVRRTFFYASLILSVLSLATLMSLILPDGPLVLAIQAAYPLAVSLSALALLVSVFSRNSHALRLAAVSMCCWVALLADVQLSSSPSRPTHTASSVLAPSAKVVSANLLFSNPTPLAAVDSLLSASPDILVTVETPASVMESLLRAGYIHASRGALRGEHIHIWSKYPSTRLPSIVLNDRELPAARIDLPMGQVSVVGVHLMSPTTNETFARWRSNWERLSPQLRSLEGPVVVAGDFNASRVHAKMRDLAQDFKLTSASPLDLFAPTWPTAPYRRWPSVLQLLDLDHILVRSLATDRFSRLTIPGSDHLGVSSWVYASEPILDKSPIVSPGQM